MADYQLPLEPETDYVTSLSGNTVEIESQSLRVPVALSSLRTATWQYRVAKRCIDIGVALVMLIVSLIPGLVIAGLVAATTDGPIFYREWRVGRGGQPFRIWKFRSMNQCANTQLVADAPRGVLLQWRVSKDGYDPRITPVGRFLRQWSLDELPQVLNVLRGEMSLVGPRPVTRDEIPLYGSLRSYYYAAVPGLSGLWQVSGRSNINFKTRVALDVSYVHDWSLMADCRILLKTLPAVLGRTGAR